MDEFIRYRESDRRQDAPWISLELQSSPTLSITLPYYFTPKYSYEVSPSQEQQQSITVQTDALTAMREGHFILLRKCGDRWEKVEVQTRGEHRPWDGRTQFGRLFKELHPGRAHESRRVSLPDEFYDSLQVGESYVLLWPGGKIKWWDWGAGNDQRHRVIGPEQTSEGERTDLILPASASVEFTVVEEDGPWPDRENFLKKIGRRLTNLQEERWRDCRPPHSDPWPEMLSEQERIPNAPRLTRSIEGPAILSLSDREDKVFTITTTYEDTDGAQPITFLDNVEGDVYDDDYYTLMKHDTVTGLRDVGIMYLCRFGIDEEPDHGIEEFSTIHPGQSITEEITLKHGECPHDFWEGDIGFKFTYCFEGKKLQWWDWGTEEDHAGLKIGFSETSHDKRPAIVIPSATYEFEIVE